MPNIPPFVPTSSPPTAQDCEDLLVRPGQGDLHVFCTTCGYAGVIALPLSGSDFDTAAKAHEAAHRAFSAFGAIP